ncbi:TonB-dependent siderophore receptor [Celerinatantimonas yamalensis]|uniref:TonB-dependent receptor n=1 Tax=Celerinatantimonas yamalensis TaxID=559956 RepID=A0ABW9G2N3_9GAMM
MPAVFRLSLLTLCCHRFLVPVQAAEQTTLDTLHVVAQSTGNTSKTSAAPDQQSITIDQLSQSQIHAAEPQSLSDAVSLLPGIQATGTNSYSYTSRGFALSRDSVKIDGMNAWVLKDNQIPLIAIDHVDVLKGAGSMLYGGQPVGGTLNVVTKKPQAKSYHVVEIEGGSYASPQTSRWVGGRRMAFDSTGALNDQQTLLYRIIGDYKGQSGFAEQQNNHGFYLTPMLSWQPDDRQSFTAQFELTRYRYNDASALVAPENNIDRVASISTNYYGPQNQATDQGVSATLTYQRKLPNTWQNTTRWRSVWHRDERANFDVSSVSQSWVTRRYRHVLNHQTNHQVDSYFTGQWQSGSIEHFMTLGGSYAHTRNDFNRLSWGKNDHALNVSVYSPQFSHVDIANISHPSGSDRVFSYDTYSLYAQDVLALSEKLNLQVGGRIDWQHRELDIITHSQSAYSAAFRHYWVPNAGISYQINPSLRWHVGYSQSYQSSSLQNSDVSGQSFEPTRGIQYETGLHFTPNQPWSGDLNLFHIIKKNVIVQNSSGDDVALGRVRSQGAELSVVLQANAALNIIAAYTYLDTKVLEGDQSSQSNTGNAFINAPHHRISVQSYYQATPVLRVGAIVRAQTSSFGSSDNQLILPGFATVDLTSRYQLNAKTTLDLSVKNVFDKTYYSSAKSAIAINAGEPRYLQAKLRYLF